MYGVRGAKSMSGETWGGGGAPDSGAEKLVSCDSHKRQVLESQGESICDIMHEKKSDKWAGTLSLT